MKELQLVDIWILDSFLNTYVPYIHFASSLDNTDIFFLPYFFKIILFYSKIMCS